MNITKNNDFNSYEVTFDGKPSEDIRAALKAHGYRWHGVRRLWYGYTAPDFLDGATVEENAAESGTEKTSAATAKKQLAPLWERCDVSTIPEHCRTLGGKEIGEAVRKHLRERFPEVRFSLRQERGGWTTAFIAEILASPYTRERVYKNRRTGEPDKYGYYENSEALEGVLNYFKAYLESYNYDNSDHMTDYFDVNFYGHFEIADKYEQTEPTEEQRADIAAFSEAKKADEERKEAEYLKARAEEEKRAEEARKKHEADKATAAAGVEVVDLPEAEQIAAENLRECRLKACTLEEVRGYLKEDDENERDTRADAVISRKLIFKTSEALEAFSRCFMSDFDFLDYDGGGVALCGGISLNDFNKMTAEQRERVGRYIPNACAVYFGGALQFVIDTEGYTYARYILIPDEKTITATAAAYLEKAAEAAPKLSDFYIPETIKKQTEAADLKAGEKITILKPNGMIINFIDRADMDFLSVEQNEHAEPNAATIHGIKSGGGCKVELRAGDVCAIFRGALPPLPRDYFNSGLHDGGNEFFAKVCDSFTAAGYEKIADTLAR